MRNDHARRKRASKETKENGHHKSAAVCLSNVMAASGRWAARARTDEKHPPLNSGATLGRVINTHHADVLIVIRTRLFCLESRIVTVFSSTAQPAKP